MLRSARKRSLPVYIEFPRDMVGAPCERVPVLPRLKADKDALFVCADEIAARLKGAKSAAIMIDVEVRRYGVEDGSRRWVSCR